MTRPSGSKVLIKKTKTKRIKKKKTFGALVAAQFGSYFLQSKSG